MNAQRKLALLLLAGCPTTQLMAETKEHCFGFPTPGLEPKIFAPDVVSKSDRGEMGCIVSADGNTAYFGVHNEGWIDIHRIHWDGEKWSESEALVGNKKFGAHDPALSLDETKLYFVHDGYIIKESRRIADLAYIELNSDGSYSEPIILDAPVNTKALEFYTCFTNTGDLVFSSNRDAEERSDFDIYRAKPKNDGYADIERFPVEINTSHYEVDAYIAPDESYIIYCADRPGGAGRTDLYVNFAKPGGGWTPSVSLGDKVNKKGGELCPFVTRDGRFLFYSRGGQIYWVDARILEPLREQAMQAAAKTSE